MVSKDDKISDVVSKHPETISVFLEEGLHCIGCCAANFESVEQGCSAHGMDAEKLIKKLNKKIEENKKD